MPTRCYAQSKMIVLQSNGDVYPCEYLHKCLGNIKNFHYSIQDILEKNREIKDFIKNKNCYCTWECALSNNIVNTPRLYPAVIKEMIADFLAG
nr:SPASM domain-containing protein [Candidatus Sigynarchaeota archaeon]